MKKFGHWRVVHIVIQIDAKTIVHLFEFHQFELFNIFILAKYTDPNMSVR